MRGVATTFTARLAGLILPPGSVIIVTRRENGLVYFRRASDYIEWCADEATIEHCTQITT
jgi:hypothetical protein